MTGEGFHDVACYTSTWNTVGHEGALTGVLYAITIPAEGIAILDGGRVGWNDDGGLIFSPGQHDVRQEGGAASCAALD